MRAFIAATSLRSAYGGPAYSVGRLAGTLAGQGVDVGVWAADGSTSVAEWLDGQTSLTRLAGSLRAAAEEFGRADIAHDNGLWLRHNHWLAGHCAHHRIARVVSTRGMLEPWAAAHKRWKKQLAWSLYQRRDLRRAQALHATAQLEARNLEQLALGVPIHTIPNGVDVPPLEEIEPRRAESSSGQRTALFVGRLYPVKGLPMLIQAWANVRPQGWRLRIVGPDESGHKAELERLVEMTGLGEVVSFPGPVTGEAKRAAYVDADLFVLSSHSESFGMAAAEALAHGLPVLATTSTPWEVLESRRCGWLAEPTAEGLAIALQRAISTPTTQLRQMGERGRQLVIEAFGWESVGRSVIRMYEAAIQARAEAGS